MCWPKQHVHSLEVPYGKLFSLATRYELLVMHMGNIAAFGNGLSNPLLTLFFGDMIDSLTEDVRAFQLLALCCSFARSAEVLELLADLHDHCVRASNVAPKLVASYAGTPLPHRSTIKSRDGEKAS
eukprot:1527256-Amphidinium_carterae.1